MSKWNSYDKLRLFEVSPEWITSGGIFSKMASIASPPWVAQISAQYLDMQYHGNHSGRKLVSPFLAYQLEVASTKTITDTMWSNLANMVWGMYSKKWTKLWDTLNFTYNPINNYDMTETYTESTTGTEESENEVTTMHGEEVTTETTTSNKGTIGTTNELTHGHAISKESEANANQATSVYGFNSSEAVPTDTQTGGNTVKDSETHNGKDTTTISREDDLTEEKNEKITHGGNDKDSATGNKTTSGTENHTLTRSGNIGVTTSQQMIESERELWLWDFFDVVFADVDSVLTIQTY